MTARINWRYPRIPILRVFATAKQLVGQLRISTDIGLSLSLAEQELITRVLLRRIGPQNINTSWPIFCAIRSTKRQQRQDVHVAHVNDGCEFGGTKSVMTYFHTKRFITAISHGAHEPRMRVLLRREKTSEHDPVAN